MTVLATIPIEWSSLLYLAFAVILSLAMESKTDLPILSGLVGSIAAITVFCLLGILVPGEFGSHVSHCFVDPFFMGHWRSNPSDAFLSVGFHIGAPTIICIAITSAWFNKQ